MNNLSKLLLYCSLATILIILPSIAGSITYYLGYKHEIIVLIIGTTSISLILLISTIINLYRKGNTND